MEQRHIDVLTTVKAVVGVPVAVKLSPYFSSVGEVAVRLDRAGADGLVLFNRFMQPDIDPESLGVTAGFGLSSPAEARLPRAWIALLAGRVKASLAASTGVEDAADVAAYLLAGADVVMTTSALLRHGPEHATALLDGLTAWMTRKGFRALDDLRGKLAGPAGHGEAARERAGYVDTLLAADRGGAPGNHGPIASTRIWAAFTSTTRACTQAGNSDPAASARGAGKAFLGLQAFRWSAHLPGHVRRCPRSWRSGSVSR